LTMVYQCSIIDNTSKWPLVGDLAFLGGSFRQLIETSELNRRERATLI